MKPYVAHDCRNIECNNRFLALDDNNATTFPPKSKYCDDCAAMGMTAIKDPAKVARGKQLAEMARMKRMEEL